MIRTLILILMLIKPVIVFADAPEPSYKVLESFENNIEIRDYDAVSIVHVLREGSRAKTSNRGFFTLVDYINGKNQKEQKIPMTAPVSQFKVEDDKWDVSFYMPEGMVLNEMPKPTNKKIAMTTLAQRKIAAIKFSGLWMDGNFKKHEKRLRDFLNANNYNFKDKAIYSYYNPPFKPWFLRRNEVMFELN